MANPRMDFLSRLVDVSWGAHAVRFPEAPGPDYTGAPVVGTASQIAISTWVRGHGGAGYLIEFGESGGPNGSSNLALIPSFATLSLGSDLTSGTCIWTNNSDGSERWRITGQGTLQCFARKNFLPGWNHLYATVNLSAFRTYNSNEPADPFPTLAPTLQAPQAEFYVNKKSSLDTTASVPPVIYNVVDLTGQAVNGNLIPSSVSQAGAIGVDPKSTFPTESYNPVFTTHVQPWQISLEGLCAIPGIPSDVINTGQTIMGPTFLWTKYIPGSTAIPALVQGNGKPQSLKTTLNALGTPLVACYGGGPAFATNHGSGPDFIDHGALLSFSPAPQIGR